MELVSFLSRNNLKKKTNIQLAKQGDNEAFTTLIDENLTSLYRVARGILILEEDIEDAIQNTILLSFKGIKNLKDERYFKTWLIRILINECNKIYKSNKKTITTIIDTTYTVDTTKELDLYNAISSLQEELKVTTILYYFDDLSYKEIAKILDIAEGTVKSRLYRSKEKLYDILAEKN